jgi:hypothetical protein
LLRSARRVATTGGQTPVRHPKMSPPKPHIQPQKPFVASTPPVFLGFLYDCQGLPEASEWFLFFSWRPLDGRNYHREGPQIHPTFAPSPERPLSTIEMELPFVKEHVRLVALKAPERTVDGPTRE